MTAEVAPKPTFWDVPIVAPDGAWREKRRLASELRQLAALCVTTDAPETTLSYAADAVGRIAERLAQYPRRTFKQGIAACKSHEDIARFADRSTMTGLSNPYSPPMELSMEGERAIARVTFGPPFEGIPGHVHGGIVAAAFDQLFGYLQVKSGHGSLTAELTVRYRRPTPLLRPLHLEARVISVEGRRSVVTARMLAGEDLTAEADGIFIALDPTRLQGIIARSDAPHQDEDLPMFIDYTADEKRLRLELRAYFARIVTGHLLAEVAGTEGGGPLYRQALEQMGADGWLGIGWPKEFGGQARGVIDQYVFFDEVQRAGFPIPFLTLCTVGPTLMKYGTEEQKARLLPAILQGKCHFAIGYSEPSAGTDLAALRTRAVRDGDHYVVHGQKVFTSLAEYSDYVWLAVRTDPDAPRHKGISILMVDTKAPGYSLSPIFTLGGNRTNATYFDNVRVPVSMLVGRENDGWKLITTQLNHERVALMSPGPIARFVEETIAWARETRTGDGRRVIDTPWVQEALARAVAHVEVLKLLTWRQAASIEQGRLDPAESSTVKVFGSESFITVYRLLLEVLGPEGLVKRGSPGAILNGRIEQYYRTALVLTFGGGTNEVQRDIIAQVGLQMPRAPR